MSYESNRWSYPDKEKDDLSVHSTAPDVVNGKTTLDVEEYVLSDEEREGVRKNNSFRINDVPEVNIFGDDNKLNYKIEYKKLTTKEKKLFDKLTEKQKTNVMNNWLFYKEDKVNSKENIDRSKLMNFINNPSLIYTGIDTKGFSMAEINDLSMLSYKEPEKAMKEFKKTNKISDVKFYEKKLIGLQLYDLKLKNGGLIIDVRGSDEPIDWVQNFMLGISNNFQYRAISKHVREVRKKENL